MIGSAHVIIGGGLLFVTIIMIVVYLAHVFLVLDKNMQLTIK